MISHALHFSQGHWCLADSIDQAPHTPGPKAFFTTARVIEGETMLESLHFQRLQKT